MTKRKSKKRIAMGEEAWAEHQRQRKNNKAKVYNAKNVERVVDWRRRTKERLLEYKGGKCEKCGYCKPIPSCYDFHHKDPQTKEFSIAAKGRTRSLDKLKKEVDKCLLLCRNCHSEIHALEYEKQREETKQRYKEWLENKNKAVA